MSGLTNYLYHITSEKFSVATNCMYIHLIYLVAILSTLLNMLETTRMLFLRLLFSKTFI